MKWWGLILGALVVASAGLLNGGPAGAQTGQTDQAAQTGTPTPPAAAPAPLKAAGGGAVKSIDQQVQDVLKTCAGCHGVGAANTTPTRPDIAGQKAEYIRRQLWAFKGQAAQSRKNSVMQHTLSNVPENLFAPLARKIAQLSCVGEPAKGPLAAAKKPPLKEPLPRPQAAGTCAVCHGANGIGVQQQVPNLAGQKRAYLRRQLLLIREAAWGALPREGEAWRKHPILAERIARFKISDIDALAGYYASLDCRGDILK